MRKTLVTITFICYIVMTCGVILNFHYCMNRLDSTKLFTSASKTCGRCGMHTEKSKGCCRDEMKIVKVKVDQQKEDAAGYVFNAPVMVVVSPSAFIDQPFYTNNSSRDFHNHSPPLLTEQDTYLKNGVFRI